MEITYRTKNSASGIGIQVDLNVNDPFETTRIESLKEVMTAKGFEYKQDNIPPEINGGKKTCYFYRNGSELFGLHTDEEAQQFIKDSLPILKAFDKKFKKTLYYYDNN